MIQNKIQKILQVNVKLIFFCLFFVCFITSYSQVYQNKKVIYIETQASKKYLLDTCSIIPGTVTIRDIQSNETLSDSLFFLNYWDAFLILSTEVIQRNTVLRIEFQSFPFKFTHSVSLYSVSDKTQAISIDTSNIFIKKDPDSFSSLENNKLTKSGNITRGISVGNAQNPSLQSSFNLQLNGQLTDDISISAVITDNTIPLQPEGNTQQIQEFDKVYIELTKKNSSLVAGDYELSDNEGFLRFNKKSQGVLVQSETKRALTKKDTIQEKIQFSAGISKGKFSKNSINGVLGNQGPYKLKGSENELFITVLSGTEKIFLNGKILQRGQENDYIIDYNTAELTFTSNQPITNDSRIIAEFQYSDKNYVRTLFTGSYSAVNKTITSCFSFYSEQDAKNQALMQTLSDENKILLSHSSSSSGNIMAPGWDSTAFNSSYILYEMVDSLGYDSIFRYSSDASKHLYKVNFSFVGTGKGNYIQEKSTINGKVFKWVKPEGDVLSGDYEPYVLLVAPGKQQMLDFESQILITPKIHAGVEFAFSKYNKNTFSAESKSNIGDAMKFELKRKGFVENDSTKTKLDIQQSITYMFQNKNFSSIERFRTVEFEREGNLDQSDYKKNQHTFRYQISLDKKMTRLFFAESEYFIISEEFSNLRNTLSANISYKKLTFTNTSSLLYSKRSSYTTHFLKQNSSLYASLGKIKPGILVEQEINIYKNTVMLANSYEYFQFEPFIMLTKDTVQSNFKIYGKYRKDLKPITNSFEKKSDLKETGIRFQSAYHPKESYNLTLAYREINNTDTSRQFLPNDRNLLAKFEHNANISNGLFISSVYYETGSGLESKKEYTYLEVAPGLGQYIWNDYNKNSVKELDEFEIATFQGEGNYIKILLPVNSYVKVYNLNFNTGLTFNPSVKWGNSTSRYKKIISLFSEKFNFLVNKKIREFDLNTMFNPFTNSIFQPIIISQNSQLRNSVYYRKGHPVMSMWYNFYNTKTKMLMVNGFESRILEGNELRYIWNFLHKFSTDGSLRQGKKLSNNEFMNSKNFQIQFYEIEPRLSYQDNQNSRISLFLKYRKSLNTEGSVGEQCSILSIGPDVRYFLKSGQTFNFTLLYHSIYYNAEVNTPLAFEMLESLQPGTNFTWNLGSQFTLSKNFTVSVLYEGKKPGKLKIIHVGSVQIQMLL